MARDYKGEYKKFHSSPKAKAKRGTLNKKRRDLGIYGKGGKDVSHMSDGSTRLEDPSKNRGNSKRTQGDRNARGKGSLRANTGSKVNKRYRHGGKAKLNKKCA